MVIKSIPDEVNRFFDWLYEQITKGGDEVMQCPVCDAEMDYNEETETWECPECSYTEQRN